MNKEMASLSLPAWLDDANKGDQAAMLEGLKQYYPLLVSQVRKTYLPRMWEDGMQEARLAFIHAVKTYDRSVGVHFGTYVKRIVWGRLTTWRRKMIRIGMMEQPDVIQAEEEGELSRIEQSPAWQPPADDSLIVEDWLASLSHRERLVALRLMAGWSVREVAQDEHVSIETVKTWKKRARAKFARFLP